MFYFKKVLTGTIICCIPQSYMMILNRSSTGQTVEGPTNGFITELLSFQLQIQDRKYRKIVSSHHLVPECILNMCLLMFQALDFSLNFVPHILQFLELRSICEEELDPPP